MDETKLIENLKSLVRKSISSAKKAHDLIFDKSVNNAAAIAYLNKAISFMASAESLYYSNFDILMRNEAEDIFNQFDIFSDEFLTNFATNHSHQWTDIEYQELMKTFEYSAFAFENQLHR